MTNNEKEEKGRIQVVTPLSLQKRWDELQNSSKYKDAAKYKLIEDMISSMEIAVFGEEHPAYEKDLEDLDKCWNTIRNVVQRLIADTEKAKENARKEVRTTLRALESEAERVPQLEKENQEYWDKYFEMRNLKDEMEKALKEEKTRTAEAVAARKEAEAKMAELQNRLNEANATIVKQMQDFMTKYSASIEMAESTLETVTSGNDPIVSHEVTKPSDNIPTDPGATTPEDNITKATEPDATAKPEADVSAKAPRKKKAKA